jgi:hypothetical protein
VPFQIQILRRIYQRRLWILRQLSDKTAVGIAPSDIAERLVAAGGATSLLTKRGEIPVLPVAESSFACVAVTSCQAKTAKRAFANSARYIEILFKDFLLIVIPWIELAEVRSRDSCL